MYKPCNKSKPDDGTAYSPVSTGLEEIDEEEAATMSNSGLMSSCFPWASMLNLKRERKLKLTEQLEWHESETLRLRSQMDDLEENNDRLHSDLVGRTNCIADTYLQLKEANCVLHATFDVLKKAHNWDADQMCKNAEKALTISDVNAVQCTVVVDAGVELPGLMMDLLSLVDDMKLFSASIVNRNVSQYLASGDMLESSDEVPTEVARLNMRCAEIPISDLATSSAPFETSDRNNADVAKRQAEKVHSAPFALGKTPQEVSTGREYTLHLAQSDVLAPSEGSHEARIPHSGVQQASPNAALPSTVSLNLSRHDMHSAVPRNEAVPSTVSLNLSRHDMHSDVPRNEAVPSTSLQDLSPQTKVALSDVLDCKERSPSSSSVDVAHEQASSAVAIGEGAAIPQANTTTTTTTTSSSSSSNDDHSYVSSDLYHQLMCELNKLKREHNVLICENKDLLDILVCRDGRSHADLFYRVEYQLTKTEEERNDLMQQLEFNKALLDQQLKLVEEQKNEAAQLTKKCSRVLQIFEA